MVNTQMLSNNDSNFEKNWRRQQELRMRPVADRLYKQCWGDDIKIERLEQPGNYVLDRFFGVDLIITFPTGMMFTGQEKFLSPQYASWKSLTAEYMNSPDKKGDWFHLASQFYFCGYASKNWDSFQYWVMANWASIVIATLRKRVKWYDNSNQDGHARASFRYCKIPELPPDCIIASSNTFLRDKEGKR